MEQEIPKRSELETSDAEASPHPRTPIKDQEDRILYLMANIALQKTKLENTLSILNKIHVHAKAQEALLNAWQEELAALKEGQLPLPLEESHD